jgi:peroxiredoxin
MMHILHLIIPAIHFIADDKGAFVSSVGLIFDASGLLGGPRSKVRYLTSR